MLLHKAASCIIKKSSIISKVSRSGKSGRRSRRTESYKQKGNAINLPDRKKKLNDDDETQQHTDGQQHVCLVSLAFYCSIYGILWRQRYHQVWRRHGHIFTSLWCNLQLSFSRLIDFELWHLHLAVWVPVSGPNLQSYLQPSATKVDKLFNLRLMRILLHDRK